MKTYCQGVLLLKKPISVVLNKEGKPLNPNCFKAITWTQSEKEKNLLSLIVKTWKPKELFGDDKDPRDKFIAFSGKYFFILISCLKLTYITYFKIR